MNDTLVSIIVAVWNVEAYLQRCIESLLSQTHSSFEIILVDDGSTDKSGDICDNFAAKDKHIKVIHKINGGGKFRKKPSYRHCLWKMDMVCRC